MKDFISIDVESALDRVAILNILSRELPEYKWRSGDSDAAGGYVYGTNQENVNVEIWTDERPMELSIYFRSAKVNSERMKQIVDQISKSVTQFGKIVRRRDM